MNLVTAEILIGGDLRNTVVRGEHNPITVPEIEVLRAVHGGEETVKVGEPCGTVKRSAKQEKIRLVTRYGKKIVDAIYPGINGNGMDVGETPKAAPAEKPKAAGNKKPALT